MCIYTHIIRRKEKNEGINVCVYSLILVINTSVGSARRDSKLFRGFYNSLLSTLAINFFL